MTKIRVFAAYSGSSVGKTFCVNAEVEAGFHNTDCGRKKFFKTFDDLKDYWNSMHSCTSFQEMGYTVSLLPD